LKTINAIIIDDNPVDLYYLDSILKHRGFQVQSYVDPVLTPLHNCKYCPCSLKSAGCPDLIVSDYNMPVVNGVELLESAIKKGCRCRHHAIISGKGLIDIKENLIRMAKYGTRFFTKPLDLDDFYDWLDLVEQEIIGHQSA
jgi:CheY-like chemotaxis protein